MSPSTDIMRALLERGLIPHPEQDATLAIHMPSVLAFHEADDNEPVRGALMEMYTAMASQLGFKLVLLEDSDADILADALDNLS